MGIERPTDPTNEVNLDVTLDRVHLGIVEPRGVIQFIPRIVHLYLDRLLCHLILAFKQDWAGCIDDGVVLRLYPSLCCSLVIVRHDRSA